MCRQTDHAAHLRYNTCTLADIDLKWVQGVSGVDQKFYCIHSQKENPIVREAIKGSQP